VDGEAEDVAPIMFGAVKSISKSDWSLAGCAGSAFVSSAMSGAAESGPFFDMIDLPGGNFGSGAGPSPSSAISDMYSLSIFSRSCQVTGFSFSFFILQSLAM
jgi:hypothetical protein